MVRAPRDGTGGGAVMTNPFYARLIRLGLIPGKRPRFVEYHAARCPHCGGELPPDDSRS